MEHYFQKLIAQNDRQIELLEKQVAVLKKMTEQQAAQIQALEQVVEKLLALIQLIGQELPRIFDEPLMDKNEVMKCLKISDATYRRYVKDGKLVPMNLDKIDWYCKRDLAKALLESRRKGKV